MTTDEQPPARCPFWVRALLELSIEPALFVRSDGDVEAVNPSALRLLDLADLSDFREVWPGLDFGSAEAPADRPHMLRAELKVGEQPRHLRLEMHPVQDETHPGHLVTLRDEDRPSGHLLLASRMRMTSRIVQALCHDLRTPLNSMVLQLELLRSELGGTGPEVDEHLGIMSSQIAALARSVTTIYELSALGPSDPDTRFDLRDLAREAIRFADMLRMGGGVDVASHLPDEPVIISGRRIQILQVLMTLIANALENLLEEGRLDLTLSASPRLATLELSASGAGVAYAVKEGAPERRSRHLAGAGADLHAARLAVERHGGSLLLDDGGDGCVRAALRLPLARSG